MKTTTKTVWTKTNGYVTVAINENGLVEHPDRATCPCCLAFNGRRICGCQRPTATVTGAVLTW